MQQINSRAARLLSLIIFTAILVLTGLGLYLQAATQITSWGMDFSVIAMLGTMVVVSSAVGTFILWYYPANWIGWLLCVWPLGTAIDQFTFGYYQYTVLHQLPVLQAALVWQTLAGAPIPVLFLTLLFFLFPTGRPLSRRWRRALWLAVAANLCYFLLEGLEPGPILPQAYKELQLLPDNPMGVSAGVWAVIGWLKWAALAGAYLGLAAAVVSLIVRLRGSKGEERQQIKWFAYFAVLFPIGTFMGTIADYYPAPLIFFLGIAISSIALVGMNAAIAIAIFRYRLYAIDVIIRRTLVYGLLTGFLLIIYFTMITVFQGLVSSLSGQQSPIVIVVSTLIIAAMFNPLRHRIQDFIDRRFYRRKYDADDILRSFAAAAQDAVDMDPLTTELLKVVVQTLQPESVSLWLREQ